LGEVNSLYNNPARPSAFSTVKIIFKAAKSKSTRGTKPGDIDAWLSKQDAYTKQRPERKNFPRNQYTVKKDIDVWECDLVDVQALAKFNGNYRYLLKVIGFFQISRYLPAEIQDGDHRGLGFSIDL
jgi:hypothetical protein